MSGRVPQKWRLAKFTHYLQKLSSKTCQICMYVRTYVCYVIAQSNVYERNR
jgi:hypothetical protein